MEIIAIESRERSDPTLTISQYLASQASEAGSGTDVGPTERSLVARLCLETTALFRFLARHIATGDGVPGDAATSVRRSCARLKLWSDGYGVSEGKLDEILAKSGKIRRATGKGVVGIAKTLSERLVRFVNISANVDKERLDLLVTCVNGLMNATTEDEWDSESSDSDSDFEPDSIDEVAKDLETDTTCLMKLDAVLKDPVFDPKIDKTGGHPVTKWSAYYLYCDKVSNRFPHADKVLVERLGKANYERFLRCLEDRNCKEDDPPASEEATTASAAAIPGAAETIAGSKFHDSGLGSSLPTISYYAETIMSYGHSDSQSVRIPPLPEGAKEGVPFECLACGHQQVITNNSAWKRHLYQDLQPWLCLDVNCASGAVCFRDRDDWIAHLAFEHKLSPEWTSLPCPLCQEDTGAGKVGITSHLSRHLEEVSLSALPRRTDDDDGGSLSSVFSASVSSNDITHINPDSLKQNIGTDVSETGAMASKEATPLLYGRVDYDREPSPETAKNPALLDEITSTFNVTDNILRPTVLKGDNIQGEGEVRVQRSDLIRRVQKQLNQVDAVMGSISSHPSSPGIHEQSRLIRLSFSLHVTPGVKSIHLCGSWDSYAGKLPLYRNKTSSNSDSWKGIFHFSSSTIEAGQRYWYYYIIDGYHRHNPSLESTVEPTTGRTVNILNVSKAFSSSNPTEDELPTTMTVAARNITEDAVKGEDGDTDADEPRYCYCGGVGYGGMISCGAEGCEREWFHMECAGLKVVPKLHEKWYCEDCKKRLESKDPDTVSQKASRAGGVAQSINLGFSDMEGAARSSGSHEPTAMSTPSSGLEVPLDTDSLMNPPKPVKRFAGCETCRKRKVKCDGLRPVCAKCMNTARHCLGYKSFGQAHYGYPQLPGLTNPSPPSPPRNPLPPQQQKVDWPDSVRARVQRTFFDRNHDPTIQESELETKLKEVISSAKDSDQLYTTDWDNMPLPQVMIREQREAELR